jgi:hypothetical protein
LAVVGGVVVGTPVVGASPSGVLSPPVSPGLGVVRSGALLSSSPSRVGGVVVIGTPSSSTQSTRISSMSDGSRSSASGSSANSASNESLTSSKRSYGMVSTIPA